MQLGSSWPTSLFSVLNHMFCCPSIQQVVYTRAHTFIQSQTDCCRVTGSPSKGQVQWWTAHGHAYVTTVVNLSIFIMQTQATLVWQIASSIRLRTFSFPKILFRKRDVRMVIDFQSSSSLFKRDSRNAIDFQFGPRLFEIGIHVWLSISNLAFVCLKKRYTYGYWFPTEG